ncbi:MAG TPA: ABC transporter permease [Pyrinomonadaceae bacterium]|jgi:lipoprotein-releasing system permease protein|nr:ABC transporter permease [Pyrinomonadaceae bacterium]
MPYEIFFAMRYLRLRRGRRGAAQLTALAAMLGIACGVGALIVAMSLANGFRDELQDKILRGTAHLTLMPEDGRPFADWRASVAALRGVEGVTDATATTYTGALLSGPDGAAYTIVRGVDTEAARVLAEIRRTLVAGSIENLFLEAPTDTGEARSSSSAKESASSNKDERAPSKSDGRTLADEDKRALPDEDDDASSNETMLSLLGEVEDGPPAQVIVGAELAARTGLARVGAEGWLVSGEKSSESNGFAPRIRRIRVAGLFRSGLYDYDAAWTYTSLAMAASMSDDGATDKLSEDVHAPAVRASVISVEVADIYATRDVAERIRRAFGEGWTIVDWREANRALFAALELERRTVTLIIMLIMLVAALNITVTLALVVVERRADIAILGALGARASSIMSIFVLEGALIGAIGASAGVALGLVACFFGNYFGLVRLPPDVYSLTSVPLHPHTRDVLFIALAAFAVSLLATLYPARNAARVRPAEALRHE